jgi:glycosyltransferase involved in cell wall biosynthesis
VRLLILSQYFWPENFRINELAAELARRGHSVTVLTGTPNYPQGTVFPAFRADPDSFSRFGQAEILRVPMLARGRGHLRLALNYVSFALSACVFGAWKLRGRQYDLVFVYQVSPATIGLPAVLLSRLKRARMFFWVQDLWPDTLSALRVVRSNLVTGLVGGFMRWVYNNSDHLLAQSRAFLPSLRQRAPAPLPVSYMPNWADHHAACGRPMAADVEKQGFDIYYLGNLGAAQGLPAVLDAIAALSDTGLSWHFVGTGSAAAWLSNEVERRGLTARVRLHGPHPPEDMPNFYRQADALLVSLRPDPLFALTIPSKVPAYLAAGLPIIGMLDGEGARVIEEAGAGVTCPAGDSEALAAAVRRLCALPPQARQTMAESGQRYCQVEFNFSRIVDQLESLFG